MILEICSVVLGVCAVAAWAGWLVARDNARAWKAAAKESLIKQVEAEYELDLIKYRRSQATRKGNETKKAKVFAKAAELQQNITDGKVAF